MAVMTQDEVHDWKQTHFIDSPATASDELPPAPLPETMATAQAVATTQPVTQQ